MIDELEMVPNFEEVAEHKEKQIVFTIDDSTDYSDFERLNLYTDVFNSNKERKRFIKSVESIVRKSPEYKIWRKFILEVLGDNYCLFTHEVADQVTIELHHHPFTLYDIISLVVDKYLAEERLFNSLIIATDVLQLHYENKIGYVPMVKTLHEKYHNGFLDIPIDYIRGNYMKFYNEYQQYMDKELKAYIDEKLKITKKDVDYLWIKGESEQ